MNHRDQIAATLRRIYERQLTTTSGGNLSCRDGEGNIWITPAGRDKGVITGEEVVCVRADGSLVDGAITGLKPSSEFPFHKAIYDARPDIGGIVHAHPASMLAMSCARQAPDADLFPGFAASLGTVGYAPYALPGSEALGEVIAATFAQGADSVILENHGVCCGGRDLWQAFQRFESMDFAGCALIQAAALGFDAASQKNPSTRLNDAPDALPLSEAASVAGEVSPHEVALRETLASFVRRAYRQGLMTCCTGLASARLSDETFLITPPQVDRGLVEPADLMRVSLGAGGRFASHGALYRREPAVQSIFEGGGASLLAFSLAGQTLNTHVIPESYMFVGEVEFLHATPEARVACWSEAIGLQQPAAILDHRGAVTAGATILAAYDRLEVLEYSAAALLAAKSLGGYVALDPPEIRQLREAFPLG